MARSTSGVDMRSYGRLMRALEKADRDTKVKSLRALRRAVEPVRVDAQTLALQRISHVGLAWSRMRSHITRKGAAVKLRAQPAGTGSPKRRPNLGWLLLTRAMRPAMQRNKLPVRRAVQRELARVSATFNKGH